MDYFQIIPLLALTVYFFYMTYYCAAPMFCLKILLFYAHIKYRNADIRFRDEKIIMRYANGGEEHRIERALEIDPTSRFFAMTLCAEFRELLREIRKGVIVSDENDGLSAGKRTCRTGRQRTEEDRD